MPEASDTTISKESLIDTFRDPAFYPHSPDDVREIQTHISWVFIARPFVYKVKKPVSMGFLDFSTLEKRRFFCEQEIRLNRRLCGDVYLEVVPVSEVEGQYILHDASNIVEYAVKMHELSGGDFAHDLVQADRFDRHHIDRIVEKLAAFYGEETPTAEMAAWGRIEKLRISTDENFEQTHEYAGSLIGRPAYEALRFYTDRFFDVHARLFNRRRAAGRILECHGDLHLEHAYLTEEDVCIYDCIEFNERLRTIDVANDTAFLAMDLDFHGRPHLARYFTAEMARALQDAHLLTLVDFYKCYRAYVRAKVESMKSEEEEVPAEEREESRERASRFYQLALRYAAAGSSSAVIIVMGRVGTGKSAVARRLSGALGWDRLSSDIVRKSIAGVDPLKRGTAAERGDLYSSRRTEETYAVLKDEALKRIAEGHGSIIDATYSKRPHREDLRTALAKAGAPYCFLELTASDETLRDRLRARDAQEVVSDARLEDFELLSSRFEAPDDLEDAFHLRVSSEQREEDTLTECLRELIRLDLGSDSKSQESR